MTVGPVSSGVPHPYLPGVSGVPASVGSGSTTDWLAALTSSSGPADATATRGATVDPATRAAAEPYLEQLTMLRGLDSHSSGGSDDGDSSPFDQLLQGATDRYTTMQSQLNSGGTGGSAGLDLLA